MVREDEAEVRRLTDMLAAIDEELAESSPLREALQKAGLAISYAFMDGRRKEIESVYDNLDGEFSDEQLAHLRRLGFCPDDPTHDS